jgi:hypothetical protein
MPVILATQEAEIRRIEIQSQPRQIVYETLSQKKENKQIKKTNKQIKKKTQTNKSPQKGAGRVAQGVGPEFKPQYHTEKK